MPSSSTLIKKRSDYYAFKQRVSDIVGELDKAIAALDLLLTKVSENFVIDNENGDSGRLKKVRTDLDTRRTLLNTQTLPAIEFEISSLSSSIDAAIELEEEAKRKAKEEDDKVVDAADSSSN